MSSVYTKVNKKKSTLICIKTNKSIWEKRASKSSVIIIAIIKSFQRLTTALSNARVEIKRLTLYFESTKKALKKKNKGKIMTLQAKSDPTSNILLLKHYLGIFITAQIHAQFQRRKERKIT